MYIRTHAHTHEYICMYIHAHTACADTSGRGTPPPPPPPLGAAVSMVPAGVTTAAATGAPLYREDTDDLMCSLAIECVLLL